MNFVFTKTFFLDGNVINTKKYYVDKIYLVFSMLLSWNYVIKVNFIITPTCFISVAYLIQVLISLFPEIGRCHIKWKY